MKNITSEKLFKLVKKGPQSDFYEQCPPELANARAANGDTLLMVALRKQRRDIVAYLLDWGADVTPQNQSGTSALHICASTADVELCRRLLLLGASVNARTVTGMTPLMHAARLGHAPVVEFLLEHGAEIDAADAYGRTAVLMALLRGHASVVSLLEARGACLSKEVKEKMHQFLQAGGYVPVRDFCHPFSQAVREGAPTLIDLYLEVGMHFSEEDGSRLVSQALELDNPAVLDALLANGCYLDDVEGSFLRSLGTREKKIAFYVLEKYPQMAVSLLSAAISQGSRELLARLCAVMGSEISAEELSAALLDAIKSGDEAKVQMVMKHGASFPACAELHPRMFELVVSQDNLTLFELMLQHGCVCDIPAVLDRILAAKKLRIAHFLVQRGLLNLASHRRALEQTLIMACHDGRLELVRLLLQMGVDVNASDADDRTPFNQALKRGLFYECINICCWGEWRKDVCRFRDILALLLDRGATLHAVEKHAELPAPSHQRILQEGLHRHGTMWYIQLITDRALARQLLSRLPQTMTWI